MLATKVEPCSTKGFALDCVLFQTWREDPNDPLAPCFLRKSCRLRATAKPILPRPASEGEVLLSKRALLTAQHIYTSAVSLPANPTRSLSAMCANIGPQSFGDKYQYGAFEQLICRVLLHPPPTSNHKRFLAGLITPRPSQMV
jgi:hypothetical protein